LTLIEPDPAQPCFAVAPVLRDDLLGQLADCRPGHAVVGRPVGQIANLAGVPDTRSFD